MPKRLSITDCDKIAKARRGKCLSKRYHNNHTKMQWMCKHRHVWRASFHSIKDMGSWCSICSGNMPLSIAVCRTIARENNGRCLSKNYANARSKIKWQCDRGHIWENSLYHVKMRGQWCPVCKSSCNQRNLFEIIKDIFKNEDVKYNFRNFSWLKTRTGHRQEIDIYVPRLKLAIEYDGKQHFMPIKIFGGIKTFNKIKRLDKLKNANIQKHPRDIRCFIRFCYKDKIKKALVVSRLIGAGVIK